MRNRERVIPELLEVLDNFPELSLEQEIIPQVREAMKNGNEPVDQTDVSIEVIAIQHMITKKLMCEFINLEN
ncbi:hypothetical protein EKG35_18435 [Lysinibacillus telephonicus]|uniref:Uncharacterized protein n=1 Tax=Lysinibacillus telephonicus TaxID=1714840 RepID=A0A431UEY9_9BACI|nr:hypothetical protein [Lysinibacillus telephonicus]RTQ87853.1 hypothetical protein EKG35_18435 [Lysinibacillus telephonicus]